MWVHIKSASPPPCRENQYEIKIMTIIGFFKPTLTCIIYAWHLFLMARPTTVVGLSTETSLWSSLGCQQRTKTSTATDTCDVHRQHVFKHTFLPRSVLGRPTVLLNVKRWVSVERKTENHAVCALFNQKGWDSRSPGLVYVTRVFRICATRNAKAV